MDFYAVNGKRPVRLSAQTRKFAYESLNHKYGLDTQKTMSVKLDDAENFETLSELEKYDLAIRRIAQESPIQICEGEKISGAATLGLAISHLVPAVYREQPVFSGISHLTLDFQSVVKYGANKIKEKIQKALSACKNTEKKAFLQSAAHCFSCFELWHERYLTALKNKPEYKKNYENLSRVPFSPAHNFHEAVQSLWFTFAFTRLCGIWSGIGRLDVILGEYLENDLNNGILTLTEAREILAHFFIKGCEWICGGDYGSGDAQHYQNIVLSGVNDGGRDATNSVTYLVLDILEELNIGDFPTTVRIGKNTDPALLKRVAEVMRLGGGVLAVYNEDLIIQALIDCGYPVEEARTFANDGCWEVQIPGKTYFSYSPRDILQVLQKNTLHSYDGSISYDSFEELYAAYIGDLKKEIEAFAAERREAFTEQAPRLWKHTPPCTVVSLFEQGCIEKGLSYTEGGPIYNLFSPHIGGLPDAANSLYAIKKLVFDDRLLTWDELISALKNNWENNEPIRRYALNKYRYFGNDNDEVDEIYARIIDDFADICEALNGSCGYAFPAGISTFGRQLEWSASRMATPFGKKAGEILAPNSSPTPGTEKESVTAAIRSYCKANLGRMTSGAALDVKLLPSSVNGEDGLQSLVSLMRGFVALGGFFMQLDVADCDVLKKAQASPEEYQTLSVRVSGWNARFVTLNKEWQDMIIAQAEK